VNLLVFEVAYDPDAAALHLLKAWRVFTLRTKNTHSSGLMLVPMAITFPSPRESWGALRM
jgi:hypothetical protein